MYRRLARRAAALIVAGLLFLQTSVSACISGFVGCAAASTVCTGILDCDIGPHYVYYTGNNPSVTCTAQTVCTWCTGDCAFCLNVNLRIVTDCEGEILEYNGPVCCRDWLCCPI